jgi:hypothetical protein
MDLAVYAFNPIIIKRNYPDAVVFCETLWMEPVSTHSAEQVCCLIHTAI